MCSMFLVVGVFAKKWDAVYINKLIANGDIDKVIKHYQDGYYSPNRDPQTAFKIAELYVKKKDYSNAITWYDKESQLVNSTKVNLYNYAYANQLAGNYQKALDAYLMYAAQTGETKKVKDLAEQCEKILRASANTAIYKLDNYTYNTPNDEVNVSVLRNNPIYFENKTIENKTTNVAIYQIVRNYDNFSTPINAIRKKNINYNITAASFTQDGNKVVFSASETSAKSKLKTEKIYFADNLAGNLLNIQPFPYNADHVELKNPAFNAAGTAIYFSSNMEGSLGGYDIWESKWENGKWTKPTNLGKLVNTLFNEVNPFIVQDDKNQTLYFSSNRTGGFGGYDIYTVNKENGKWQNAVMQPAPINSSADDIGIIYDNEIKTGYFSSDRKGGKGGFDIYRFIPFNLKVIINSVNATTKQPIDYALVQLFENNLKLNEGVTNEVGNAIMQVDNNKLYTIKISKDNYATITQKINTKNLTSGDSIVIIADLQKTETSNNNTNNAIVASNDYIIFTGQITDGANNQPAKQVKMRMVNYATQKLRDVEIDNTGKFEVNLMLDNNYKVIFQNQNNKIIDEITTLGLDNGSVKVRDYTLNGNKFKLTENRVYKKDALPANIKVSTPTAQNQTNTKNELSAYTAQTITNNNVDSVLKAIAQTNTKAVNLENEKTATTTTKNEIQKNTKENKTPTTSIAETVKQPEKSFVNEDEKIYLSADLIDKKNVKSTIEENETEESPDESSTTDVLHVVLSNQTLFTISKMYNVSVKELQAWNHLSNNKIKVGSVLLIRPTESIDEEQEEETQEITESIPQEVKETKTPTVLKPTHNTHNALTVIPKSTIPVMTEKQPVVTYTKATSTTNEVYHTVEPKQTLYSIAKLYAVSVKDVQTWNQLSNNNIKVGSALLIKNKNVDASNYANEATTTIAPKYNTTTTAEIIETKETISNKTVNSVKATKKEPEIIKETTTTVVNTKTATPIIEEPVEKEKIKENITNSQPVSTIEVEPVVQKPTVVQSTINPEQYYKIQITSFEQGNITFPEFEHLGKIEVVSAYSRYLYRIGNFPTLERANQVLEIIRSQGYFVAFILQYNNEKITSIIN